MNGSVLITRVVLKNYKSIATCYYTFRVGAKPKGGFEVQREECRIYDLPDDRFYVVNSGHVENSSPAPLPPAANDRLFLVTASSLPEFRPLYDCLTRMGFYNLNPDEIRDLQPPDAGEVLLRDGRNLAGVLGFIGTRNPKAKEQVVELLSKVVPGVVDVTARHVGKKETIEFRQKVGENESPWRFMAENMSDGTLRALGVLTALFQSSSSGTSKKVPLVGIEEPEVALHPGAAGVLRDGLRTASRHTQVLVTSHSPDLLDDNSSGDFAPNQSPATWRPTMTSPSNPMVGTRAPNCRAGAPSRYDNTPADSGFRGQGFTRAVRSQSGPSRRQFTSVKSRQSLRV